MSTIRRNINNITNIATKMTILEDRINDAYEIIPNITFINYDSLTQVVQIDFDAVLSEYAFKKVDYLFYLIIEEIQSMGVFPDEKVLVSTKYPTVNCDDYNGYNIGDILVNVITYQTYVCYSNATNAAIWNTLEGYGFTGPTGPTGTNGQDGATGSTGPTGQAGQAGQAGETGQTGPTGQAGAAGQAGETGQTGATGMGITGPTGPMGPNSTSLTSYFSAYRAGATGNTDITIPTGNTGLLIPFPTKGANYAVSGSWAIAVDNASITVPVTGLYQIFYGVTVENNSSNTRTMSSYLRINGVIMPGAGACVMIPQTHVNTLVGQHILQLNAGDVVRVYVATSGNNTVLSGTAAIITADNTSSIITMIMLG